MSQIEKVEIINRKLIVDSRGWFLKALTGREKELPSYTGEVYLTMSKGGQVKGMHWHQRAKEWFTLVAGSAILQLEDVCSHEKMKITLDINTPSTVFIPNGVAHKIYNETNEDFILLAYTDLYYAPKDTISYTF